jgi:YD repeat-containing protein
VGKIRNEQESYSREMGLDQKVSYDANNNALYVGRAFPGAAASDTLWQIYKMEYDANNNMTSLRWAGGTDAFDKIYNSRTTYNYTDI